MRIIRVLVVDDHTLFRTGVADVLRTQAEMEVVGEAQDGAEALQKAQELLPDVILMDIYMPGVGGLEATRRIKDVLPQVKIVMLTVSEEDNNLFEAIKAGACGYLVKKIEPDELVQTICGVVRGEAALSRVTASKILDEFARLARRGSEVSQPQAQLSPRELEILQLLTGGATNKAMASVLGISENTVKNHLRTILEKLHLENRTQAAAYALRTGLIHGERH